MPNSLVQFRVDENVKKSATLICDSIGIDIQSYLRLCLIRLIAEEGIPFSMKLSPGMKAVISCSNQAKEDGLSDMSLDEINKEIEEYRKNKK